MTESLLPGIHFIALRALSKGVLKVTLSTCEACGGRVQENPDRPCHYVCPCKLTTQIILTSWLSRPPAEVEVQ